MLYIGWFLLAGLCSASHIPGHTSQVISDYRNKEPNSRINQTDSEQVSSESDEIEITTEIENAFGDKIEDISNNIKKLIDGIADVVKLQFSQEVDKKVDSTENLQNPITEKSYTNSEKANATFVQNVTEVDKTQNQSSDAPDIKPLINSKPGLSLANSVKSNSSLFKTVDNSSINVNKSDDVIPKPKVTYKRSVDLREALSEKLNEKTLHHTINRILKRQAELPYYDPNKSVAKYLILKKPERRYRQDKILDLSIQRSRRNIV